MRTDRIAAVALGLPAAAAAQLPATPEAQLGARARSQAAPLPPGVDRELSLSGELSTTLTRGNSNTFVLAADGALVWAFHSRWLAETEVRALHESADDETVASSWSLFQRFDRFVSGSVSLFAAASFDRDLFAEIDWRVAGQLGASHVTWTPPEEEGGPIPDRLKLELGALGGHERFGPAPDSAAEPDEEGRDVLGLRAAAIYHHAFDDRFSAGVGLEVIENLLETEDLVVRTSASATAAAISGLALRISLRHRFDNLPASSDLEKHDLLLLAGLVVSL